MLRHSIPVFDGSNPALTDKWLKGIESLFAGSPQHHAFRAAAARAKLSDVAAVAMADYIEHDWAEFKLRLLRRFNPEHARVAIELEIMSSTRYVSGSFLTALDRAVADFEFLGPAFPTCILRCLAFRVPASILASIKYSPADDFLTTIEALREMAAKAQLRADRASAWAIASDPMALAVKTRQPKTAEPVRIKTESEEAKPIEEPRSTQSKSAKRQARYKARLAKPKEQPHALTGQMQDTHLDDADPHLFQ
jgi:hypothetical protein